jgi:hypothetical protein
VIVARVEVDEVVTGWKLRMSGKSKVVDPSDDGDGSSACNRRRMKTSMECGSGGNRATTGTPVVWRSCCSAWK